MLSSTQSDPRSVPGTNSSSNAGSSRVAQTTASSMPTSAVTSARPSNSASSIHQSSEPRSTPVTRPEVVATVEAAVSTIVEPDLNPIDTANVTALAQQTQVQPGLVDEIFKTLFKRPLGKDPVVAFRGLALLHILLRDGSSEVTSQSVTNDGFLGWIEASWSRERIQSRPAHKAHRLSHCFAVGELAWYASFLRRRASFFSTHSKLFSPHWNVRPDALSHTSENHRVLRTALLILEGASSVIKRIVASSDPTAPMKRSASLPLIADIAYAYRACCWLYATAHQSVKRNMRDDLDSAHHATRSVFRVVMTAPLVAELIPPKLILNLDENPPRNFQLSATPSSESTTATPIKKKKSRRKKPVETVSMEQIESENTNSDTTNISVDNTQAEAVSATKAKSKSSKKKKERFVQSSTSETAASEETSRRKHSSDTEDDVRNSRKIVEPLPLRRSKSKDAELSQQSSKKSKKKTRKKKSKRSKDESSSDSDTGSDSESDDDATNTRTSKKSSKKKSKEKRRAEKNGQPQQPPPRKAPPIVPGNTQPGAVVAPAESREGSREALAAAAMGKKTPQMNKHFEVAPYEVQFGQQIGSGSFGVVYTAKFRGRTVAVKKIHAHALRNAASISEFQSEVAVLCTLKHPNILGFMGACTKPPNLMIITEFMGRGTLFDVLHQSQQRITWPMRRKFALDTCRGMRYLHDSKLLHRDLKSSNLMLDDKFNTKVGDFGLTRTSAGTAAMQMTGQCGTFQYMAVEVLSNKPYSEKADVFSFGILLWEMVARKLPYFGMQPMQVGMAVVQQGLRPTIPPKTPAPLAKLMRACWDSEPMRRPSFAQLVEMLEAMPE